MSKIEFRNNFTEVRTVDNNDGKMIIEGIVNNVGEFSKVIYGSFREKVNTGVFKRAIEDAQKNDRDIFFLALHNSKELPLASIKSNTMELKEENNKLYIRAELPPTTLAKDIYELVKSKVLREFSFGFSNAKCEWGKDSDNIRTRTITSFDLHEVSIVTTGAYNNTSVQARSLTPEDVLKEIEQKEIDDKKIDERYLYNKNKLRIKTAMK